VLGVSTSRGSRSLPRLAWADCIGFPTTEVQGSTTYNAVLSWSKRSCRTGWKASNTTLSSIKTASCSTLEGTWAISPGPSSSHSSPIRSRNRPETTSVICSWGWAWAARGEPALPSASDARRQTGEAPHRAARGLEGWLSGHTWLSSRTPQLNDRPGRLPGSRADLPAPWPGRSWLGGRSGAHSRGGRFARPDGRFVPPAGWFCPAG